MAFYRRRPRPDAEKCADPAKARASALETLAGQEVSANMLYERLCRRFIQIFCKFMELSDIILKDFQCFLVFHPDKLHNLLIQKSLCLKRTA